MLSAPEAIAALNRQRTENGIPGDLIEEPRLSAGCLSWATSYHDAAGQYPHEEISGQPGYTPEGSEAAGESDLAGEPFGHGTIGTTWDPQFNPWSGAALHEAALMDPFATSAWYGASQPAACMGATGSRPFSAPAFYSFPGPGAKGVPIAVNTGELPFSPEQAIGLGSEAYVAPAITLWDAGSDATLQAATLTASGGGTVPTSIVTPGTPTPNPPANFPASTSFSDYTRASFVVPRVKFAANTTYTLTATWRGSSGTMTQSVTFTTATGTLNQLISAAEIKAGPSAAETIGSITPRLKAGRLTITATGIAVGRTVRVQIERCPSKRCARKEVQRPWRRAVRLAATTTLRVPKLRRGFMSVLTVYVSGFRVSSGRVASEVTGVLLG